MVVVGGAGRGGSVAAIVSFCLHPNCDHKTVNGRRRQHNTAASKQPHGSEAYGSCTTGQKEHSAEPSEEVAATKLT